VILSLSLFDVSDCGYDNDVDTAVFAIFLIRQKYKLTSIKCC